VVHRQQLLDQWQERLAMFLNLPAKSIGHIGGGKMDRTGCVDVAVIQSLYRKDGVKDFVAEYGQVIVDEWEDYLRFDCASVTGFVDQAIKSAVQAEPGILLRDVLERVKDVAKHDDIYLLIASGEVYVDLGVAAIVEPERVRVFANAKIAAAYQRACPDLDRPNCRNGTPPEAAHGEAFRLLTSASEQDLKTANERFHYVKFYLDGERITSAVPGRTLRLWLARYRLAKARTVMDMSACCRIREVVQPHPSATGSFT
jgi:hypothetical protein